MKRSSISWSMEGEGEGQERLNAWATKLRNPLPALDEMADVILSEQRQWWRTHGGGTWARRKEPYHTWMRRKYPQRPILRGPDRPGHKGLQLRNQLTRRPFGFEKITAKGLEVGTDLEYAPAHQYGIPGRMPARPPLKALTPAAEARMVEILRGYIFKESVARGKAKGKNPMYKGGRSSRTSRRSSR